MREMDLYAQLRHAGQDKSGGHAACPCRMCSGCSRSLQHLSDPAPCWHPNTETRRDPAEYPAVKRMSVASPVGSSRPMIPMCCTKPVIYLRRGPLAFWHERQAHCIQDVDMHAAAIACPRVACCHWQAGVADAVQVPWSSGLPTACTASWRRQQRLLEWLDAVVRVDAVHILPCAQLRHLRSRQLCGSSSALSAARHP